MTEKINLDNPIIGYKRATGEPITLMGFTLNPEAITPINPNSLQTVEVNGYDRENDQLLPRRYQRRYQ